MLKLNVGLSRKVGEANYGSRGASVNLELEVESTLAGEPDRLREKIRQLFLMAKTSVNEELNGIDNSASSVNDQQVRDANQSNGNGHDNGNGHSNGNANGNGHGRRSATESQVRAIHAIARRQSVDLAVLLRERFGSQRPDDLSISAASELIDELKGTTTVGASR